MVKRIFDITLSVVGLLMVLPLLSFLALLIRRDDGGPAFYRGVRVGLKSRPFKMFKFRTMVVNAAQLGGPSTADDDSRITAIGKLLRAYKLDELPQLINILKGDMSFVGPRPEVPQEVETYSDEERNILDVRPGITDWASIVFHNEGEIIKGSSDPHRAYREKIRPLKLALAAHYARNHSFWVDVNILAETFRVLLVSRLGDGSLQQSDTARALCKRLAQSRQDSGRGASSGPT